MDGVPGSDLPREGESAFCACPGQGQGTRTPLAPGWGQTGSAGSSETVACLACTSLPAGANTGVQRHRAGAGSGHVRGLRPSPTFGSRVRLRHVGRAPAAAESAQVFPPLHLTLSTGRAFALGAAGARRQTLCGRENEPPPADVCGLSPPRCESVTLHGKKKKNQSKPLADMI